MSLPLPTNPPNSLGLDGYGFATDGRDCLVSTSGRIWRTIICDRIILVKPASDQEAMTLFKPVRFDDVMNLSSHHTTKPNLLREMLAFADPKGGSRAHGWYLDPEGKLWHGQGEVGSILRPFEVPFVHPAGRW